MKYFAAQIGPIAFSGERKRHIIAFHPDVGLYMQFFAETLAHPDFIRPSANDPSVSIYYRSLPRRRVYLAIVVKAGSKPFVLTAYLAQKPKRHTI